MITILQVFNKLKIKYMCLILLNVIPLQVIIQKEIKGSKLMKANYSTILRISVLFRE